MPERPERRPTPFGERVKAIRKERGYSVSEVTRRAGIANGYLTMIEKGDRGSNISRDMVISIATGLRATDDERDDLLRLASYPPATDLPATPTFVEAVNTDVRLRADQKRVLVDLYTSMVR